MSDDLTASSTRLRRRLGAELRHLRSMARVGGRRMATVTGLSQTSVSRVESGARRASRAEVDAWLDVTGADPDARDRVLSLLKGAHAESTSWADLLTDTGQLQDQVGERERAARVIQEWSPEVVPGLLQTRAYAEHLVPLVAAPGVDPAQTVARRMERQRILYEPGRRFVLLTTRHALHRPVAPDDVMAAQRAHLAQRAELEGVRIAVVGEPWPLIASSEFMLYGELDEGDPFVAIELTHGAMVLADPEDVAVYRDVLERLDAAAWPVGEA